MKKGGRPKLADPKIKPIGFRASTSEALKIRSLARSRGIPPGKFCRLAALGKKLPGAMPPAINFKTWVELGRIGQNLNQVVKQIHLVGDDSGLISILEELRSEIRQVRREITDL